MLIRWLQSISNNSLVVLNIESNSDSFLKLKVFNVEGKIAKSVETKVFAGHQDLSLNVSDLSSGNYILNAFYEGGFIQSIKFNKQ
jgi:hypothetical protein